MRKTTLITYEEYEHLEKAGDNIFFSRAAYDV